MKFIVLTVMLTMSSIQSALADVNATIDLRLRSQPRGMNLVGILAYDGLLWGRPAAKSPLYGYYRIGAQFASAPLTTAFIEVSPIAPLVLGAQKSWTTRFAKNPNFDCDVYECTGSLERTDYVAKLAGAYGGLVFVGQYLSRDIKTPESVKDIALELETFSARPGNLSYKESSLFLGYRRSDNTTFGILRNDGEISDGGRRNHATYGIVGFEWLTMSWFLGAGDYRSDQVDLNGFSAVMSLSKSWGTSLSLF